MVDGSRDEVMRVANNGEDRVASRLNGRSSGSEPGVDL